MFAVPFYESCFDCRGNLIGKKNLWLDWEKAVYWSLFALANTRTVHKNGIFFLLSFFGFFSFSLFSTFFCFLFVCVCVLKQKVYILIHIRLCRQVNDKTNFTHPTSENKTTFFWPKKKEHNQHQVQCSKCYDNNVRNLFDSFHNVNNRAN